MLNFSERLLPLVEQLVRHEEHVVRGYAVKSILFLFTLLATPFGWAQDAGGFWTPSDSLHMPRAVVVVGAGAVGFTGAMIGLNSLWYANQPRSSFHFFNDNADWLQMDKAGHAYSGYQLSRLSFEALSWSGVRSNNAAWMGTGFGMLFLTGIEVLDGFSEEWGFSTGDVVANVAGGGLFLSQQLLWEEQRIALKFGFAPSGLAHYRPETLGNNTIEQFFKDYNGQTYWLSVNPASFRNGPRKLAPWLNVAFGYSGTGMLGGSHNPEVNAAGEFLPTMARERQFLLSLDVDLTRIPTRSGFLKTLFSVVNVLKVPAPAVELRSGSLQWHWMYF